MLSPGSNGSEGPSAASRGEVPSDGFDVAGSNVSSVQTPRLSEWPLSARSEPLLKEHGVDHATVVAKQAAPNLIALLQIEADGPWIVGSGLDADCFEPGRHSALLEPREDMPAQSPAALLWLHAKKDKVCGRISIVHDSERKQASALLYYGHVRGPGPDSLLDPAWQVAPAESVFDGVAR